MRPVDAYWGHFSVKSLEISTNGSKRSESSRWARRLRAHRRSPNGIYGISCPIRGSVRLDARELDHLAPLLRFLGNEFPEIGGRERDHGAAEVGKPRLDFGITKAALPL